MTPDRDDAGKSTADATAEDVLWAFGAYADTDVDEGMREVRSRLREEWEAEDLVSRR